MKITDKNLQRYGKKERKTVPLCIRITPTTSRILREKNLSPTAIFYTALSELGIVKG
jgi:hypothetical protein